MSDSNTNNDKLIRLKEKLGLSQPEIAKYAAVSVDSVKAWCSPKPDRWREMRNRDWRYLQFELREAGLIDSISN
ncbi:MAG: hypothetical protein OEZ58_00075 [Gammaproteobacteria bacterium]|nr:hypothetical protein [Gammaproteobacteria bacterium]